MRWIVKLNPTRVHRRNNYGMLSNKQYENEHYKRTDFGTNCVIVQQNKRESCRNRYSFFFLKLVVYKCHALVKIILLILFATFSFEKLTFSIVPTHEYFNIHIHILLYYT